MRFTSLSLSALSISVALGLCVGGCNQNKDRAASTYHPTPAAWYGPSAVSGTHAALTPSTAPTVLAAGPVGEAAPGMTRATANVGGTGGGPTDGSGVKIEHRGHVGMITGTVDDGTKPVSRTGQ